MVALLNLNRCERGDAFFFSLPSFSSNIRALIFERVDVIFFFNPLSKPMLVKLSTKEFK